jgi:hypothetical protein
VDKLNLKHVSNTIREMAALTSDLDAMLGAYLIGQLDQRDESRLSTSYKRLMEYSKSLPEELPDV